MNKLIVSVIILILSLGAFKMIKGEPSEQKAKKLCVTSWQGDFELEGPTIVRDASELGDDLDWVLVGLKSTALEQENVLRDLLEPCVAPNTRVQLLMNGLGAEEKAAEIVDACAETNSASGAPDNSSLSHFSAMTRPSWLGRAVRNRHRHAIEQTSRRWRGGRRDDSARTRRKILISIGACRSRRHHGDEAEQDDEGLFDGAGHHGEASESAHRRRVWGGDNGLDLAGLGRRVLRRR